jgi:hypothetical protein
MLLSVQALAPSNYRVGNRDTTKILFPDLKLCVREKKGKGEGGRGGKREGERKSTTP